MSSLHHILMFSFVMLLWRGGEYNETICLILCECCGVTGAILWTACALIAILFPGLYKAGADLLSFGDVGHFTLNITSAIFGGVLFTLIAWVIGYIFGWNLVRFSKK